MDLPLFYPLLILFYLSLQWKLKCQIALSLNGLLLQRSFCRDSIFYYYLKIETLLMIATTATIATAIIVIVSIKQSPFFKSINNYCSMFN